MARASLALVLLAGLLACSQGRPPVVNAPAAIPVRARYEVAYDGKADLRVEASIRGAAQGGRLSIENGAERFIHDLEVRSDVPNAAWSAVDRKGGAIVVPACVRRCDLRYRFQLREAAKSLDDLEVASEEGAAIEAPPSTWLLAPVNEEEGARVRFHVTTTPETSFHTGVFGSAAQPGTWEMALGDLWTSPYSVFGPLRSQTIEVPDGSSRIDLVITPGGLAVSDPELVTWASDAARAITTYFGRFPMPTALVIAVPSRGRWMGMGKTLSGGGGSIFVRVGERAPARALRDDWVLVHEMIHLTLPSVPREQKWAEEGLATYVEPFARSRAGLQGADRAWHGLVEGLPHGLPAAGDRGLDHTPTWGRTYWGGALFYLLADIEIRKRTNNTKGLEHALRGILARGGNNTARWSLEDVFTAGDEASGVPVLRELHREMAASPHPVDLEALWAELGIVRSNGMVHFDDRAPLAGIRLAIDGGTSKAASGAQAPTPPGRTAPLSAP